MSYCDWRYLDIRVTKYLSAFYGEHGLYTRQLKKYLKEIRLFVEEHPTEVVILHFELSDHLDRADKRRLVTVLFQVCENYLFENQAVLKKN